MESRRGNKENPWIHFYKLSLQPFVWHKIVFCFDCLIFTFSKRLFMWEKLQSRVGPEKYWPTSKKLFLAFLFHKNSENIEKTVGRFDPGSISALRVKLAVELHDLFVFYWPLKHIYFFRAPSKCLMGFYSGPALLQSDFLESNLLMCNW